MNIRKLLSGYKERFGYAIGAYVEPTTFVVNPYGQDSGQVAESLSKMGHKVLNKLPRDASNRTYSIICKL